MRKPGKRPVVKDIANPNRHPVPIGQDEHPDDAHMASHGHPHAAAYRRLRQHFEAMPVSTTPGARHISFLKDNEQALYFAPSLEIVAPRFDDRESYMDWLTEAGLRGWRCKPSLNGGTIQVKTRNFALRHEIENQASRFRRSFAEIEEADGSFTCTLSRIASENLFQTLVDSIRGFLGEPTVEPYVPGRTVPLRHKPLVATGTPHLIEHQDRIEAPIAKLGLALRDQKPVIDDIAGRLHHLVETGLDPQEARRYLLAYFHWRDVAMIVGKEPDPRRDAVIARLKAA